MQKVDEEFFLIWYKNYIICIIYNTNKLEIKYITKTKCAQIEKIFDSEMLWEAVKFHSNVQ